MSKIQELLKDKKDKLNVQTVLKQNPWLTRKNMKCILSPDSDGLLCGLFLSHYLDWEIIGFYDGKVCLIDEDCSALSEDVAFVDIEIYRRGVKSVGHHMLAAYNSSLPVEWNSKFKECIQPNLMRGYDRNNFRLKYPLATIHLLISLLEDVVDIEVVDSAIFPLLFTDGTYKVMTSYPENVLNWWGYLNVQDSQLLNYIFTNEKYSLHQLMQEMDSFFRKRDQISVPRERGDRLKISNRDSTPYNIVQRGTNFKIDDQAADRCIQFLRLLSSLTSWEFKRDSWTFCDMRLMQFTKSDFKSQDWTITKNNWNQFMDLNPLSWAMTSGSNIEFTIEHPDKLT